MPQKNYAVEARSLSKIYRIFDKPRDRLLASIPYANRGRHRYRTFTALDDVSFELARGQTLGIVGKNGSGKSTLLQILCKTLTPTSGEFYIQGRVGALLELGSGFNPEFSGIENIFLNATILGLSKNETRERIDDILAFADIGEFVHQPVKTYSSGMVVRLAFAVQAHCDPQVLIVDEALAVGDELFQKKCYLHLEGLKEKGVSIILVTHSCPQINQQCDEAILLHKGKCLLIDKPQSTTFLYQQLMNEPDLKWAQTVEEYRQAKQRMNDAPPEYGVEDLQSRTTYENDALAATKEPRLDTNLRSQSAISYPSHGGEITGVEVLTPDDKPANIFPIGHGFKLRFHYHFTHPCDQTVFTCFISRHTGGHVTGQSLPEEEGESLTISETGDFWIDFHFEGRLWPGIYFIGGGIASSTCEHRFVHRVIDTQVFRVVSQDSPRIHGSTRLASRATQLHPARHQPG